MRLIIKDTDVLASDKTSGAFVFSPVVVYG